MADAFVLTARNSRCTSVTMRSCLAGATSTPRDASMGTDGRWCCSSIQRGNTRPQRCSCSSLGWDFHVHPAGPPNARSPPWKRRYQIKLCPHSNVEEPADEVGVVRDPKPKGTLEEAQFREHRMTQFPKDPFCEVCSKAKTQRTPKRRTSSQPVLGAEAKPPPTKASR